MSFAETALLGALAGFTIYLGLPVARLELVSARTRGAKFFLAERVLGRGDFFVGSPARGREAERVAAHGIPLLAGRTLLKSPAPVAPLEAEGAGDFVEVVADGREVEARAHLFGEERDHRLRERGA